MRALVPILLAAPWIITPIVTVLRARNSLSLDDERIDDLGDGPLVSLVIPARNEARNIVRCVRSALAADYPRLEVIVVDDHSTDGTGDLARDVGHGDTRLRVITPAPLPPGWFGKQWACTAGADAASGDIIGFIDADTWQSPDLIPRIVAAMRSRKADLLTVAGEQELGSFWERVLQPQIFGSLLARYGGTESINASPRAHDKIANGQCLFMRRDAYVAVGGHASVRDMVAEDLALAQRAFLMGQRTALVLGLRQFTTRMYASLPEIIAGWGKNVYAGGVHAMPLGKVGRALYPLVLPLPGLIGLGPPVVLLLSIAGVFGTGALTWAAIATCALLLWWLLVYRWLEMPIAYALLFPLGAALFLYIAARSIAGGRSVRWKGRDYRSA